MRPETLQFVEMLLDLFRRAPGASVFHEVEDELFHGECRLTLIEGGPDAGPVRRQSSEAEHVAVPGDATAATRWIDVTDEPQEPHQREERVASDPPGTKRAVKLEAGTLFEDDLRSRGHAELKVSVRVSDAYQRIEKRVRADVFPAGPMFQNQHPFRHAR